MIPPSLTIVPVGDSCLSLCVGDRIDQKVNRQVHQLHQHLNTQPPSGILDVVPTYRSLGIHFDPLQISAEEVQAWVQERSAFSDGKPITASKFQRHEFQVEYNGPDLERVAAHAGLEVSEVIQRHCTPAYQVAMIGFQPHFPYLLGLDEALCTPRLDSPRRRVEAGAVAIGGEQTGIYPHASPGGWNVIGYTDPKECRNILPGDSIRFIAK